MEVSPRPSERTSGDGDDLSPEEVCLGFLEGACHIRAAGSSRICRKQIVKIFEFSRVRGSDLWHLTVCWFDAVVVMFVPAGAGSEGLDFEECLGVFHGSAVVDALSTGWEVDGVDVWHDGMRGLPGVWY